MPSERFLQLKQVKKQTFLRMAYKEFALHSYEGASITRLVSDLKMAKGSIYQYFVDKEDMYNYLVQHAYDQMQQIVKKACPLPSSAAFDVWYKNYLLVQLKFLFTLPSYAFLLVRNKTDSIGNFPNNLDSQTKLLIKSADLTGKVLSNERIYYLQSLPLFIFNFFIESKKLSIKEIIDSNKSIEIAPDKLLYLCDAFLIKSI